MMEHTLVIGKRQTGKTERLIKMSAEKQIPIICINANYIQEVKRRSKDMGLSIPDPIPVTHTNMKDVTRQYNSVIVDDAVLALRYLIGKDIDTAAINTGHEELEPIEVIYTEESKNDSTE